MIPRIEQITAKKLVGKKLKMCMAEDKTFELWQSFMRQRKQVLNNVNDDLFCLQVYEDGLNLETFNNQMMFEKCAAVEVNGYDSIPEEMETILIPAGLYAVFVHKGTANNVFKTFHFIYTHWLPTSEYALDNRIHFQVMGPDYKKDDPNSEEEIWVPIAVK